MPRGAPAASALVALLVALAALALAAPPAAAQEGDAPPLIRLPLLPPPPPARQSAEERPPAEAAPEPAPEPAPDPRGRGARPGLAASEPARRALPLRGPSPPFDVDAEPSVRAADPEVGLLMGAAGAGLLGLALLAARRARRPRAKAPKRRSFDAGRALGRGAGATGEEDAMRALQSPAVGRLGGVARVGRGVRVTLARRRSEPCEMAVGYLVGLFEAAWARDVVVRHASCGGKGRNATCAYDVEPAAGSGGVTPSASRAEAGATRGSGGGPRPPRPARPGGG